MKAEMYLGLPKFVQQSMVLRVPIGLAKDLKDINTFIRFICENKSISHTALISSSRKRHLVEARQWVMYYYTEYQRETNQPTLTLAAIGDCLKRDHATVLHSIAAIDNMIKTNKYKNAEYRNLYDKIKTEYNAK